MTSVGEIEIVRTHYECRLCLDTSARVDASIGFATRYSKHATRLITLAGAMQGFEKAVMLLREMTGIRLSQNTVNKITTQTGRDMKVFQRRSEELHEEFAQTTENTEFTTDGTRVNTSKGWREMKVTMFAKPSGGTRWRVRTVNRMLGVLTVLHSDAWDSYWSSARRFHDEKSNNFRRKF